MSNNKALKIVPLLLAFADTEDFCMQTEDTWSEDAKAWYESLSDEKKETLKELCPDICGANFDSLVKILGFEKTINTIHEKLRMEGFDV